MTIFKFMKSHIKLMGMKLLPSNVKGKFWRLMILC